MNIHEYQAKELLNTASRCRRLRRLDPGRGRRGAGKLPGPVYVVKSQIHAGGRGAGRTIQRQGRRAPRPLHRRGARRRGDARPRAGHQADRPAGRDVKRVYVEAGCDIARELYLSLLVDRATGRDHLIASTEGGMEIEEVAAHRPRRSCGRDRSGDRHSEPSTPAPRLRPRPDRQAARGVRRWSNSPALYAPSSSLDCSIVEINPLVVTGAGEVIALDAKISFDDNALFRHPEIEEAARRGRGRPERTRSRKFA
jgi:succinyl-CoA synthetase beta subunit